MRKLVFAMALCLGAVSCKYAEEPLSVDLCLNLGYDDSSLKREQLNALHGDAGCAWRLSMHYRLGPFPDEARGRLWGYQAAVLGHAGLSVSFPDSCRRFGFTAEKFFSLIERIEFTDYEKSIGVDDYARLLVSIRAGDDKGERDSRARLRALNVALPSDLFLGQLRKTGEARVLPFNGKSMELEQDLIASRAIAVDYLVLFPLCDGEGLSDALPCIVAFSNGDASAKWPQSANGEFCRLVGSGHVLAVSGYPKEFGKRRLEWYMNQLELLSRKMREGFGIRLRFESYIDKNGVAHALDKSSPMQDLARRIQSDANGS